MAKKIIKSTQHPALKYVLKGASKDAALAVLHQTVNVKEGYFCAASGFVAHFAEGRLEDEDGNIDEGTYKVDKQLLAESIEGTYPNICTLLPIHSPIFSITVNPTILRDSLPDSNANGVILEFFGERDPFLVRGDMKDDTSVLALVMPTHRNKGYEGFDPCGVISKRKAGHLRAGYGGVSWQYGLDDSHEYWEIKDTDFRPEGKWVVQRNFGEDTWNAYLQKERNFLKCLTRPTITNDDGKLVAENHEFRGIDLRDVRAVMAAVVRYGKERRYV